MVVANTISGATFTFDLRDPDHLDRLSTLLRGREISALSLRGEGCVMALPCPKKFKRHPAYGVELVLNGSDEPIGERIFAQADDVRVTLTLSYKTNFARCDLVRTGRMLYNPVMVGGNK